VAVLVIASASTGSNALRAGSVTIFNLLGRGKSEDAVALYSFNWQVMESPASRDDFERLDIRAQDACISKGRHLDATRLLGVRDLESAGTAARDVIVTDSAHSALRAIAALQSGANGDAVDVSGAGDAHYPTTPVAIRRRERAHDVAAGTGAECLRELVAELDRAFENILRQLRTQYLVAYYPKDVPPHQDRFHVLKVNVTRPQFEVLTRSAIMGVQ